MAAVPPLDWARCAAANAPCNAVTVGSCCTLLLFLVYISSTWGAPCVANGLLGIIPLPLPAACIGLPVC